MRYVASIHEKKISRKLIWKLTKCSETSSLSTKSTQIDGQKKWKNRSHYVVITVLADELALKFSDLRTMYHVSNDYLLLEWYMLCWKDIPFLGAMTYRF